MAKGERPAKADKSLGQVKSKAPDQEAGGEEARETPSDRRIIATRLFWFAVAGWTIAGLLLIVVLVLLN